MKLMMPLYFDGIESKFRFAVQEANGRWSVKDASGETHWSPMPEQELLGLIAKGIYTTEPNHPSTRANDRG